MFALLATLGSCATMRRRGDEAVARRSYYEAAELYDRALQEDPKDDKARAGRARARDATLTELLDSAQQGRADGDAATARSKLARFFRLRREWLVPTPPALVAAVEREATAAAGEITAAIRPLLAADAPLAAQSALSTESGVVDEPEVAAALGKLHANIATAGQRRCDHYRERTLDGGAYWSWLVARYCKHFGKTTATPRLPYLARGLQLEASISGMSPASSAAVTARLNAALEGTPWHAADAGDRVAAELRGEYVVAFRSEPVTLAAPWTERVPYTDRVARQVPHQVSRLETESYTVQVPYTDHHSESYSCGTPRAYRTCYRSRSVTRYRTDHRTRMVTRYHTEYRTEYHAVTRYRSVPHVYSYTANQQRGSYALASTLTVNLPPDGAPLQVPLARQQVMTAISHDVTFEAADVAPQVARLPSGDEWLQASLPPIVEGVRQQLRAAWQDRFCRRDAFTVEEAARCLYGGDLVATATAGLRVVAGAEADALAALLTPFASP
jgi:hypothetical protein